MRKLIVLACLSMLAGLVKADETLDSVANSREWLNQMYYEKGLFGGYESRVTSQRFFLHPEGKVNPTAELKQTVIEFQRLLAPSEAHPQCLFPSRYLMLKDKFDLAAPVKCKKLGDWLSSYQPVGLNLVYASQYISNPASVFGHVFFTVSSAAQPEGFWMSYNFAAGIPKQTSGLGYIWGGLTGWFEGDYSVLPYYQRLFKYGSIENRDLWVFQINLSDQELVRFLYHQWELVHLAKYKYYFMDENCAGVVLRTLAANFLDMQESSNLNLYASPLEVVRALETKGRIRSVFKVDSQYGAVQSAIAKLNDSQKEQFYAIIGKRKQLDEGSSSDVIRAVIEYLDLKIQKNRGKLPKAYQPIERSSYLLAAKREFQNQEFANAKAVYRLSPASSHKSARLTASGGFVNDFSAFDLGYRFVMHDLLDPEPGFLEDSSVEGIDLKLSTDGEDMWLRELQLVGLENYPRLNWFAPQLSWRATFGWRENLFTRDSVFDQEFYGDFGIGGAFGLGPLKMFTMLNMANQLGRDVQPAQTELGYEIGGIFSRGRFKATLRTASLFGVFSRNRPQRLRLLSGLRWRLDEHWSLVQESFWSEIREPSLNAYRLDLGFRHYF